MSEAEGKYEGRDGEERLREALQIVVLIAQLALYGDWDIERLRGAVRERWSAGGSALVQSLLAGDEAGCRDYSD